MSGLDWRRGLALSFVGLIFLTALAACTPQDVQLAQSFAEDWAKTKGYDPNTPAGWVNIAEAVTIGSGDPVVDAALEAAQVVKSQQDADKLANDGLANGDIGKLNEAIKMRPNDFTYVSDRGLVELQSGASINVVKADFDKADALATTQGQNARALNLRTRMAALRQPYGNVSGPSIAYWHLQLCTDSKALYQITSNPADQQAGC